IEGGSDTLYIGFWVKGNPYYFNYWYIDNVELVAMGISEEYSDFACQGPDIEPGEEVTFTFEDWTPDFLAEEKTGTKDYFIESCINMEGDNNSGNDIKPEQFTLYYWHDVGIDEVISPVGEGHPRKGYDILWDNGDPDGRNALAGSMYQGHSNILIDDFQNGEDWNVEGGRVHILWDSGYSSNTETIRVYFFEDEGECDPSVDEYPEPDYYFVASELTEYTTGNYYFDRPEVIVEFLFEEDAQIPPGRWFVGIQPDGIIDDIAYILTAPDNGCMVMADLPYWSYPRWTSSDDIWDSAYDLAWGLHWFCCCPSPKAWIQPGLQDIDVIVMNYGTFPEKNLTCYAEIREYITDPYNGTQVYKDQIEGIDLSIPLGGSKVLQFEDFEFPEEGRYILFLNFQVFPDDIKQNNKKEWGVSVDDTKPKSQYPPILDPPEPDGNNGWYIDEIEVTLNATDPWSHGVSSGIKEIRYTIDNGEEQVISGNHGEFVISRDGNDRTVEYWAIDWVGNIEAEKNSFTIDMDQTKPDLSLSYEVTGGNPITGWKLTFKAQATDKTSGMDYVEFYFNDVLQETINGSGPTYEWAYTHYDDISVIITAIAYDIAGNFNSEEIEDPITRAFSKSKTNEIYSISSHIIQIPKMR
ncbi:MAG: hypothetical protein JSU91_07615, partial [Thermoplasmatales archaeon]